MSLRARLERLERRHGDSLLVAVLNYGESGEDAANRIRRERGDRYTDVLIVDTGVHRGWPDPETEELI